MSVYSVPRSGITQEKFKDICPSLVQQKLSNACQQYASSKKHEDREHPTDLERNDAFHFKSYKPRDGNIAIDMIAKK